MFLGRRYGHFEARTLFAIRIKSCNLYAMNNRQRVLDLISRLPEDTPLNEIARQIDFLAGIQEDEEQARKKQGIPAEDARAFIDKWVPR